MGVRLVILAPQHYHSKGMENSPGRKWVEEALNHKGNSPRYYKNTLVFLTSDKAKLEILEKNVAQYLAWESIVNEKESLNLNVAQSKQATTKREEFQKAMNTNLNETYQWLLIPSQPDPQGGIEWDETRLQGQDESFILRASRKVLHDEQLIITYSASRLCLEALNPYLWGDGKHIDIKRLWEFLAQYLYLPRLKNAEVLLQAIRDGVSSTTWGDYFAYAEGWDENKQRYLGLTTLKLIEPKLSSQSFLVRPDVAIQQQDAEQHEVVAAPQKGKATDGKSASLREGNDSPFREEEVIQGGKEPEKPTLRRFYGTVELDALRMNRDTPAIANEVIQHLTRLNGVEITITLEIQATIPDGAPDDVIRTVMENCKTLKFNAQSFEQE